MGGETYMRGTSYIERSACPQRARKLFGLLCDQPLFENELNRRMPNGTYGGVRGKETKVDQKTFVSRPTRLLSQQRINDCWSLEGVPFCS